MELLVWQNMATKQDIIAVTLLTPTELLKLILFLFPFSVGLKTVTSSGVKCGLNPINAREITVKAEIVQ